MQTPECPDHGVGGPMAANTTKASVVKCGFTTKGRRRQKFECRFGLIDGTTGKHRFIEPVPRLMADAPLCDRCGHQLENWRGEKVFKHYYFLAEPISEALVGLAMGQSYRAASSAFHKKVKRVADDLDPRRLRRDAEIAALRLKNKVLADKKAGLRKYATYSDEPNLAEWLVEACAEIVWKALAPQEWPDGGIVAVDAVKMNLLGKHKYVRSRGQTQEQVLQDLLRDFSDSEDEVGNGPEFDEDGYELAPEDLVHLTIPPVEDADHSLEEMLDPDDDTEAAVIAESAAAPHLTVLQGGAGSMPGTQGGVPCWQILGAYGYEPNSRGEFPRDEKIGKPWLFRGYYLPNSLTWAHFFRQLPGTPAYILCDMAHDIRVGVELAWPDPATRPKVITCEYHVMKALQRRFSGHPKLEALATRLFQTHGHTVAGRYEPFAPNGPAGSIRRLWHFMAFRRAARQAGFGDLVDHLFKTSTWRRIMRQVIAKDGTMRYSTGALESALKELAERIAGRRAWLKNRARTDHLLMLHQLRMLGDADGTQFLAEIEHYLNHQRELPRQKRLVERSVGRVFGPHSLRRPLNDLELLSPRELRRGERPEDVALPTQSEFRLWMVRRAARLHAAAALDRYHNAPGYKAKDLQRRKEWHEANRDQDLARDREWRERNAAMSRSDARERRRRAKEADPEKFRADNQRHDRLRRERVQAARQIARELGIDQNAAYARLKASDWDPIAALNSLRPSGAQRPLVMPLRSNPAAQPRSAPSRNRSR